jgi:hypothetical protein
MPCQRCCSATAMCRVCVVLERVGCVWRGVYGCKMRGLTTDRLIFNRTEAGGVTDNDKGSAAPAGCRNRTKHV